MPDETDKTDKTGPQQEGQTEPETHPLWDRLKVEFQESLLKLTEAFSNERIEAEKVSLLALREAYTEGYKSGIRELEERDNGYISRAVRTLGHLALGSTAAAVDAVDVLVPPLQALWVIPIVGPILKFAWERVTGGAIGEVSSRIYSAVIDEPDRKYQTPTADLISAFTDSVPGLSEVLNSTVIQAISGIIENGPLARIVLPRHRALDALLQQLDKTEGMIGGLWDDIRRILIIAIKSSTK